MSDSDSTADATDLQERIRHKYGRAARSAGEGRVASCCGRTGETDVGAGDGPTGQAYGVDMTDEMLELARRNTREAGFEAIEVEPTRIYRAEDARGFLEEAGLDADEAAGAVDGRFMAAFVRARRPRAASAAEGGSANGPAGGRGPTARADRSDDPDGHAR